MRAARVRSLLLAVAAGLVGCELLPDPGEENDASRVTPLYTTVVPQSSSQNEDPILQAQRLRRTKPDFVEPGTDVYARASATPPNNPPQPGEVTLNFDDTSLSEVVKVVLGDLLNENYFIDPGIDGSVTLQTSRPLPSEALIPTLEMILRSNGAALVSTIEGYRVVPREVAPGAGVIPQLGDSTIPLLAQYGIRIVPLRYIAAAEMVEILSSMTVGGDLIRADSTRNLLILMGTSGELRQLLETIQIFDVDWMAGRSFALVTPEFVDAKILAAEIEQVFSDKPATEGLYRIITIERLNALLVVTTRREMLEQITKWVERLDQESPRVGVQLFVYRVENGRASEIAAVLSQVFGDEKSDAIPPAEVAPGEEPVVITTIDEDTPAAEADGKRLSSSSGSDYAGSSDSGNSAAQQGAVIKTNTGMRIIADEINNAILILGTVQQYRQVLSAMRQLDIVPLQVLIEATIAETTLSDELEHGLEWFFKNNIESKTGAGTLDLGAAALAPLAPGFSYAITDVAGTVRAVLNALASDSRLNVVSSPSLMVLNNQEASIRVGDEVPVTIQQQQSTVAESNVVNSIEYRDTGVLLTVVPRVNSGGLVIMDIDQEVSDVAPGTANNLTPIIQQRTINSTVAVQSGETVVLGGLIRENKSVAQSGIPGLYKIPFIGHLFGATTKERRRTELVVLITPRALYDSNGARDITDEFRRKMRSLKPFEDQQSMVTE